jgi:hypothetical protein
MFREEEFLNENFAANLLDPKKSNQECMYINIILISFILCLHYI